MSRNIILVTIDSLRADHCGFHGYDRNTTPTLDAMADEGVVFENAIAPGPATPESMPTIFTGTFPCDRSTEATGMNAMRQSLVDHLGVHGTLAEALSRRGYTTGAFTPNPWTSHHFGFDRGFDEFEDFLGDDRSSGLFKRTLEGHGSPMINKLRFLLSWIQSENTFKPWESFYDRVRSWIQRADQPYFLWVFLMDVHFPYLVPQEDRAQATWDMYQANLKLFTGDQSTPYAPSIHQRLVTAYDDAITYLDRFFDRLRSDIGKDTAIVVHGDHGEGFGDHDTYGHQALYEENIRVPLLVNGVWDEKRMSTPISLASLPQLLVTIAERDNISEPSFDRPLLVAPHRGERALRTPNWKYISDDESAEELYHLSTDPDEQENLVHDRPEVRAACRATLRSFDTHRKERSAVAQQSRQFMASNGNST